MRKDKNISEWINKATESLNDLGCINILEEWQWYDIIERWAIKIRIKIESPNEELIPNVTDWYVWLEQTYPRGEIELIPSKINGITKTFQHQYYNCIGSPDTTWRNGRICAKTIMFSFKKDKYDIEPFEPEKRLKWHIERSIQWLLDAATSELTKNGDLFELPDFNTNNKPFTFAFCESQETIDYWQPFCKKINIGIVEFGFLESLKVYITLSFKNQKNQILYKPDWNKNILNLIQKKISGSWVLLPKIPVLEPWQAPMTWGDMMNAVDFIGEHYDQLDKNASYILIGFLIPKIIGQIPNHVHWQALYHPVINKSEFLHRYLDIIHSSLDWQKSENWHSNEIFNRGSYDMNITDSKILIIGCGAFGSMVSELLVRGGAKNIILIDNDITEIGNLTRHSLNLNDVGVSKAYALKCHLEKISPHVKVIGIKSKFENLNHIDINNIKDSNIVIDCTGSDDVLHYIEIFQWEKRPLFFSISIGLNAKRLYVIVTNRKIFPRKYIQERIQKWLYKDLEEYDEDGMPRSGGIGCWHPAFPAKCDEMWLMAGTAMKYFVGFTKSNLKCTKVAIFEQETIGNHFSGIKLLKEYNDK